MKTFTSAGIVVYRLTEKEEREYLILKYAAGHWDFPKGKLEGSETLLQAAKRELQEETGIAHIQIVQDFKDAFSYFFTDSNGQGAFKTVYFFIGKAFLDSPVTLSDEHLDFCWQPFKVACNQLTYENAQKMLCKVETFLAQ